MNLDAVQHLLPEVVQTVVKLIGPTASLTLIEKLGGTTLAATTRRTRQGEARFEELAEAVGAEIAEALTRHFGRDRLYIANCQKALLELSHREIREQFDGLTRHHTAAYAVRQLALRHHYSDRHVWRILKRADREPRPKEANPQCELF